MLPRHLQNQADRARLQFQEGIVQPIFNKFYDPMVVSAILLNPTKLAIVYALYNYWNGVANRGFLRFAVSGGDIHTARERITDDILNALILPNKAFLRRIGECISPLRGENSELYRTMSYVSNRADENSHEFNTLLFPIQGVSVIFLHLLSTSIVMSLVGEGASRLYFVPVSALLLASLARSAYDHCVGDVFQNAVRVHPGR